MAFTNKGIEQLGKHIRNDSSAVTPTHLSFAGSDNTYNGDETSINNEFIRNSVTWTQTGINSKYNVQLASTEANGSNIQTLALVSGSDLGSDTVFTINQSFIGDKTSAFNVQVEGEIIIRRPTS